MRDKDVQVYYVEDEETRHKGRNMSLRELKASASAISLRELRARACGDARAARKAARRSYEFVSADEFDKSTGSIRWDPSNTTGSIRWANGRVLLKAEEDTIVSAMDELMEGARSYRGTTREDTALREYSTLVIMRRHASEGIHGALKAVEKWRRVQPYWRRIRRRICVNCARQVALTEPRYLVCSGCGDARYCSEACQRKHWAKHQEACPAGRPAVG